MKLLARFNLIFIAVFAIGICLAIWLASAFLRADAKAQVLAQAKLMMLTTSATRWYTSHQIQPLLNKLQKHDAEFLPQTVPAYSATQVFDYLHQNEPAYYYKEATLNPTNPADRAADWEADVVNVFRGNASIKEMSQERDTPTGRSMFFARPLRIVEPACLECHSTPDRAPVSMIRQYGSANGFGWKLNEVIGAQIVSVPESLPIEIAGRELKSLIVYLVAVAVAALIVLDALLIVTVIRPVTKLSQVAEDISQGKMHVEDIPITGKDEISGLAASFNRMQRSLAKAMKMLENDDSA
jgi:protein-histidine pros-kinase